MHEIDRGTPQLQPQLRLGCPSGVHEILTILRFCLLDFGAGCSKHLLRNTHALGGLSKMNYIYGL